MKCEHKNIKYLGRQFYIGMGFNGFYETHRCIDCGRVFYKKVE